MTPSKQWSLRRLANFASSSLSSHNKIAGRIKALQKKDASVMFRAGMALFFAREKLKQHRQWNGWLKKNGLPISTVFEAISIYEKAGNENAVKGRTITEAKISLGIVKPKPIQPLRLVGAEVVEDVEEKQAESNTTPLGWYGGKQTISPTYISLFPPGYEKMTYVEVFGGGGATLFAKPPSEVEIYNDIDAGVVGFFRVLREHGEELSRLLTLTPYSREEFELCRDTWWETKDEVERARRYFVSITQAFKKLQNGHFGASKCRATARHWASKIDKTLLFAAERLRPVCIENLDFRKLVKKYDSPNAFFLVDPPYAHSTRSKDHLKKYTHELKDSEHSELLELVQRVQGKVFVCGYPCPKYEKALKGFDRWEKEITLQTGTGTTVTRKEVVWGNYDIPKNQATMVAA